MAVAQIQRGDGRRPLISGGLCHDDRFPKNVDGLPVVELVAERNEGPCDPPRVVRLAGGAHRRFGESHLAGGPARASERDKCVQSVSPEGGWDDSSGERSLDAIDRGGDVARVDRSRGFVGRETQPGLG